MSQEDVEQIAFKMISNSGEARSKIVEALDLCEEKKYEKAKELLKEAREHTKNAHDSHRKNLQQSAAGEESDINLLLIHAMDLMLVAESETEMAHRIINLERSRDELMEKIINNEGD